MKVTDQQIRLAPRCPASHKGSARACHLDRVRQRTAQPEPFFALRMSASDAFGTRHITVSPSQQRNYRARGLAWISRRERCPYLATGKYRATITSGSPPDGDGPGTAMFIFDGRVLAVIGLWPWPWAFPHDRFGCSVTAPMSPNLARKIADPHDASLSNGRRGGLADRPTQSIVHYRQLIAPLVHLLERAFCPRRDSSPAARCAIARYKRHARTRAPDTVGGARPAERPINVGLAKAYSDSAVEIERAIEGNVASEPGPDRAGRASRSLCATQALDHVSTGFCQGVQ